MTTPAEKMNTSCLISGEIFFWPYEKEGIQRSQKIMFYRMNPDGPYQNGTTLEEMLRVCSERLADLDSHYPCKENKDALEHIKEARICLDARTKDRIARGVEGKHEV